MSPPVFILRVAACTILFAVGVTTAADTDLWGHVRFGLDTLHTRSLERIDPYSFTSDQPWINHEWLAELAMGAAFAAGGATGLVVLKLVVLVLALGVIAWSIETRTGPHHAGSAILMFAGIAGVIPLLSTLRPHAFSLLLFVVLTSILAAERLRSRALWWIPVLFALWANLHGGWLVGLGTVGVWAAAHFVFPVSASPKRVPLLLVATASVLATLLNPYGVGLWRFMLDTVGFERGDIVEWRALTRLPELLVPWSITVALAAAVVVKGRAPWQAAVACALLAAASFRVGRLVPFFSLAVAVLLLPGFVTRRSTGRPSYGLLLGAPVAACVIASVSIALQGGGRPIACLPPLAALELDPQANAFLRANTLSGRLLVWFNWGEYAIWHFSPQLKVSIDGRRETVYSPQVLLRHQELFEGGPRALQYFDQLQPDVVWLPARAAINKSLPGRGWRPAFVGSTSIVWARVSDARAFAQPEAMLDACFPGP